MAVIIDNRSDISGIGKLGESPQQAALRLWEQAKGLVGKKKKPAPVAAPVSADAPAAPVTPPVPPALTGVAKLKANLAEQWAKPAVKAGVGVAGLLAAVLAWKKWKK